MKNNCPNCGCSTHENINESFRCPSCGWIPGHQCDRCEGYTLNDTGYLVCDECGYEICSGCVRKMRLEHVTKCPHCGNDHFLEHTMMLCELLPILDTNMNIEVWSDDKLIASGLVRDFDSSNWAYVIQSPITYNGEHGIIVFIGDN